MRDLKGELSPAAACSSTGQVLLYCSVRFTEFASSLQLNAAARAPDRSRRKSLAIDVPQRIRIQPSGWALEETHN